MDKNNKLETGVKVKYFPLLSNKTIYSEHEVISEPWIVCGEKVVKISGKSGCVSVSHLKVMA